MSVIQQFQILGMIITGTVFIWAGSVVAQITPDNKLPTNSSVNRIGNTINISGGTQAKSNLFHSFQQFSVNTGSTAYFQNAPEIQNIITRVTGTSISNIDGLIKANGTANLFLINPNGITFGQNARLDIGGSFVATSAKSMKFADGSEFSATNLESTPLLTISVPIGLQFGTHPGKIEVQGDGQGARATSDLIDTTNALRVQPNQTLGLVGGELDLEGATLKTAGGRIELGSVGDNSFVSLTAITKGFALGYDNVKNFGNIELAQQADVDASGTGAGDIQVIGRHISVIGDSLIEASTLGDQPGGNLTVNATDLEVAGDFSTLATAVYPQATGNGGDVNINTFNLLLEAGAQMGAVTFGTGKSGNLNVNSQEVQIIGTTADGQYSSGLFTKAESGSTGNGGELNLTTSKLLLKDGGKVDSGTFDVGKGGNLNVNAQDVEIIGTSTVGQLASGLFTKAELGSTGNGGNLNLTTNNLLVRDGGTVSVESQGKGNAGNLTVDASSIRLDNNALVSANTQSINANPNTQQANITLKSGNLIILGGSNIIANAQGKDVIGGNIKINTNVLAAVEASKISANSSDFRGGNVKITTQGIIDSPDSSITATGAKQELNGIVEINTPDINPSNGLVPLALDVVDASRLINQNVCQLGYGSSLTVTGRGGLPPNPNKILDNSTLWEDWRVMPLPGKRIQKNIVNLPVKSPTSTIVEAQGWIKNAKGEIFLTATPANASPHNFINVPSGCQNNS